MSKIVSLQSWLDENPQHSITNENLFLSEKQVRSFPHFKDASPEEIENIIAALHELALISYNIFCQDSNSMQNLQEAA